MINPVGVQLRFEDKPNENSNRASLSVATVWAQVETAPAISVDDELCTTQAMALASCGSQRARLSSSTRTNDSHCSV